MIIAKDLYPQQVDADDPRYPHGRARNDRVPGDRRGTPLSAHWVNDWQGFWQALLVEAGVEPSGPERVGRSDIVDALRILIHRQHVADRQSFELRGAFLARSHRVAGWTKLLSISADGQYLYGRTDTALEQARLAVPGELGEREVVSSLSLGEAAASLSFAPDGSRMYAWVPASLSVVTYQLAEPWQLHTARRIGSAGGLPQDSEELVFSADGLSAYEARVGIVRRRILAQEYALTVTDRLGGALAIPAVSGIALAAGHDAVVLASGDSLRQVSLADPTHQQQAIETTLPLPFVISGVVWAPHGGRLFVGTETGDVHQLDTFHVLR